MGFPIEFNHIVVLKDTTPEAYARAVRESQDVITYKSGARVYPMGYEIPVATGKEAWDVIGYARVIQQGIEETPSGFRTRLRLGSVRDLSHT